MGQKKLLIVDDDPVTINFLCEFLTNLGLSVITATNGFDAVDVCKKFRLDIVIMDINMPGINGFETCSKIRQFSRVPIIFLSARSSVQDKIMGFSCGGDDYLTKPFDSAELILRIRAILRRNSGFSDQMLESEISFGEISINQCTRTVTKNHKTIELTAKEFELLWLLSKHPHRVFTREQLVYQIWNTEFIEDATVNMLIKRIRVKVEDNPAYPKYIKTVRGVGYKFVGDNY